MTNEPIDIDTLVGTSIDGLTKQDLQKIEGGVKTLNSITAQEFIKKLINEVIKLKERQRPVTRLGILLTDKERLRLEKKKLWRQDRYNIIRRLPKLLTSLISDLKLLKQSEEFEGLFISIKYRGIFDEIIKNMTFDVQDGQYYAYRVESRNGLVWRRSLSERELSQARLKELIDIKYPLTGLRGYPRRVLTEALLKGENGLYENIPLVKYTDLFDDNLARKQDTPTNAVRLSSVVEPYLSRKHTRQLR